MPENHSGPHIDVDPFIPTGVCAICTDVPIDRVPPEDRPHTDQEAGS